MGLLTRAWPLLFLLLAEDSLTAELDLVEHQVTADQAAIALDLTNVSQVEGQGCRPCTDRQKGYCLSEDLIMDHCTCDHRHNERLPYLEHTCYFPQRPQPTYANDCIEYVRLLECCCHAALLPLLNSQLWTQPKCWQSFRVLFDKVRTQSPRVDKSCNDNGESLPLKKKNIENTSSSIQLSSALIPLLLTSRWL